MSLCISIITALLVVAPAPVHNIEDIVTSVISDVEEAVIYIATAECQNVKRILGIEYDQIDEPDLSELTVDYITNETTVKYKLNELSEILSSSWFNATSGLIIYMHGFTDNPSGSSFSTLNSAFHEQGYYNIVALDASPYIKYFYLRASTFVVYIGESLGKAMVSLINGGLAPSSIYLIGHSLGAHITGFTGRTLYNLTGSKVGRITGLDPAGPCFADLNSTLRLSYADASYVDIIHTDAGVYGLDEIIGQVDYLPNNGTDQPGCETNVCSHSRAWELYAESVLNISSFPALRCDSWTNFKNGECDNNTISYMGYASKPTTDKYYLVTNGDSPYARGMDGI